MDKGASATATHNHGPSWVSGFWDCCSPIDICLLGTFCPCLLFGKTQSRLKGQSPPSMANGDCCGWYALTCCGLQCIIQTMKRGDMRARFGIEGSGGMDFLASWCCPCCGLVQEEKESLLRQEGIDAKTGTQYQAPQGMNYHN